MLKVVRVTTDEFELEDGSVFPIMPPLSKELTVDEFQKIYEGALETIRSCKDTGGDSPDLTSLG